MTSRSFQLGAFTLDLDRLCLRGPSGDLKLRPKSFDVLRYLIEHAGHVVGREELIKAVWPDVIVTDDSLARCISEVRSAIDDHSQQVIKTVPKRGYVLDAPVSIKKLADTNSGMGPTSDGEEGTANAPSTLALPDQPSIAVLPFANMSGDRQSEYFVDGIVEDIITGLSKWRWFFVIARNTSFAYRNRPYDVREVGRGLGVRYVVEGSIRKSNRRLRVSVQLIEAATGVQLWADRFDGVLSDVFDLQDQVTECVIAAIEPQLRAAELRRTRQKRPGSLTAYDHYLQALAPARSITADATSEALRCLSLAWARDRNYAAAYGLASYCYRFRRQQGWSTTPIEDAKLGKQLAERALHCDPDDPFVLWTAALNQDQPRARTLIDRSLTLNPNCAQAWCVSGWNHDYLGDRLAALSDFQRALRLSPLDPMNYYVFSGICGAHMNLREYEKSIEYGYRALREWPGYASTWRQLAVSLAYLGHRKEAREAVTRVREIDVGVTVSVVDQHRCNLANPEERKHYLDGLRLAGLPED